MTGAEVAFRSSLWTCYLKSTGKYIYLFGPSKKNGRAKRFFPKVFLGGYKNDKMCYF